MFIAGEPEEVVFDKWAADSEAALLAMERSPIAAINFRQGPCDKIGGWAVNAAHWPEGARRHSIARQTEVVERIGSRHVPAAEIHVTLAVDIVGAGLGDSVNDQAAGLAVLGVVIVGEHLEFLEFIH